MVRQRFKPFQKAKQAKDFWDNAQEPQEGLVPLFNSPFYATPDEPADPTDCNRYPDSPYCGGNPLTAKFAPSIEVSMVRDECNLGIQFDGSFAFIKVPPVQIVYRNPNCIPEPPEKNPPITTTTQTTPSTPSPNYCGEGEHLLLFWGDYWRQRIGDPPEDGWFDEVWTVQILTVIPSIIFPEINPKVPGILVSARWKRHRIGRGLPRGDYEYTHISNKTFKIHADIRSVRRRDGEDLVYQPLYEDLQPNRLSWVGYYPGDIDISVFHGTYERLQETMLLHPNYQQHTSNNVHTIAEYTGGIYCRPYERNNSPPPPNCMCCCPNVEQNDQLLRLILKRIGEPKEVTIFDEDLNRKGAQKAKKKPQTLNDFLKLAVERIEIVSRIVGIENFPVSVPDTVIEPHKEGIFAKIFGFIDGTKKRKINTLTEFVAWMSEQDSAVLGEFHQVLEFETGEKDKKGKPVKSTVVLPNVAETLKEITLLVAQSAKQNNVQTELIFKIAMEVVAARAAAHKASLIAADIQDYLDYPTQTVTGTIPTSVKLPYVVQNSKGQFEVTEINEDHKEFLKPGSVSFSYDDWTGDNSLKDHLMDLLQMASMLRAILYQRTDK
ncbi:MAG: hypothetical protein KME31_08495 [Tolypothrix carrinoi HA7290-LM1]|jgi:hypothetical protein|nr:hypothetical protein [Tolypothrix carrinoi HA7290-LM1]